MNRSFYQSADEVLNFRHINISAASTDEEKVLLMHFICYKKYILTEGVLKQCKG